MELVLRRPWVDVNLVGFGTVSGWFVARAGMVWEWFGHGLGRFWQCFGEVLKVPAIEKSKFFEPTQY